jgi:hypothetical protein
MTAIAASAFIPDIYVPLRYADAPAIVASSSENMVFN